jgi:hypothetical protein
MADDRFRGMNTNERLCEAGLLAQWDEAVSARDAATMTDILGRVAITEDGAKQIVATVLADPKRYGY